MIKGSTLVLVGVVFIVPVMMLCSCSGTAPKEAPAEPAVSTNAGEMNGPLSTFSQEITSSLTLVKAKPSETTMVPVTIRNTTAAPWSSRGRYPITVSYKWFDGGKILPVEGERTFLPTPIRPNESANVNIKVVAPASGKDLVLKITLVQEGVQWFMMAGATPLELPVILQ